MTLSNSLSAHALRLLATEHIYKEVAPDFFCQQSYLVFVGLGEATIRSVRPVSILFRKIILMY